MSAEKMLKVLDKVLPPILLGMGTLALLLALYGLFYIPVAVQASRDCLRENYPRAVVTFDFETYCMTLDGESVKIDELD